jgi:hypothetical protein
VGRLVMLSKRRVASTQVTNVMGVLQEIGVSIMSGYRPFRFDVTMNQQSYDFGLMLFFSEPREEDVSVVIEALYLMLTKYGLEKEHTFFPKSRFDLNILFHHLGLIFDENFFKIEHPYPHI